MAHFILPPELAKSFKEGPALTTLLHSKDIAPSALSYLYGA